MTPCWATGKIELLLLRCGQLQGDQTGVGEDVKNLLQSERSVGILFIGSTNYNH